MTFSWNNFHAKLILIIFDIIEDIALVMHDALVHKIVYRPAAVGNPNLKFPFIEDRLQNNFLINNKIYIQFKTMV